MFGMVVERVFISDLQKVSGEFEKKITAVGISNILVDCPAMLQNPYNTYYPRLLASLIEFFELPQDKTQLADDYQLLEFEDTTVGYQTAYSQLIFAKNIKPDPLPGMLKYFCFFLFILKQKFYKFYICYFSNNRRTFTSRSRTR